MENDYLKSFDDLKQELDDAKNTLVVLNDNIRRIIGRNPKDVRSDKFKSMIDSRRKDNERPCPKGGSDASKTKRRTNDIKSVFSRLSTSTSRCGDDESKPRLNSRVIRELPTRQEIVAAQCTDSESRARNRRMFGSLLGTLHKFCQEESRLKQKEDKKAQIEKKLEQQELEERATLKRERELLFTDRKRKQLEIRKLELKMNRLRDFEVWESSISPLMQFIRTKSKPHIYFKPRIMNKKTDKLLLDSQKIIDEIIEKKKCSLNKELAEFELNAKINDLNGEDNFENMDGVENNINMNIDDDNDESDNKRCKNIESLKETKGGISESKENTSTNLNDPILSSSVAIVTNVQKDKVQ